MGYLQVALFVYAYKSFSKAFVIWSFRKPVRVFQVVVKPTSFSYLPFAPGAGFFAWEADDSADDALAKMRVDVGCAPARGGQFV